MRTAVYLFAVVLAAAPATAPAWAAQYVVGFDVGNFAHPFSGC
ncbi:MAG TPA: hypothetical protein VMX79_09105 [bacterium]|nr:hypothetical protein [bacterium]